MFVYRIAKTKYANDLTGEGSRLNGGRWNSKFTACIYTSESRALALLEYTVNVNIDEIPRALSYIVIDIPDVKIYQLKEEELPGNWKDVPAPSATKNFGTRILQQARFPVIKLPSSIILQEFNYIINPLHADSKKIKIEAIEDFVYDLRIKLK